MVGVLLFLIFPVNSTYDIILLLTVTLIPGLITNGIFVIINKLYEAPQRNKYPQAAPSSTRQSGQLNFYNPNIRKENFAKRLGFDPIAFAPLDQDSMVYIHLDGDEKNDDPETHAWVSKETNDRLRSGKKSQSQKSGIGQQRKLIEQHYETYLGGVDKILDDHRGDKYHIDIYILPPNDKRNYGVMATSGMSDYGMRMPSKLKFFQHGELYIKLPPDWPYPMDKLEQDDYAWVIQNLFMLPRSVHDNRTFFWNGQVIDNDEPFAKNTELSGFLIKYPGTIDIPVEFNMLKVNPQKAICFYQLIPLYNEEMNFLEKHGLEKLYKKFDEFMVTDIVDLNRENTCKRPVQSKFDYTTHENQEVLVGKEDFTQTIEVFERAVKIAPTRVEVWKALGSAYDDNKQYKDSIKAYKKALGIQPDSFDTMVGLGMVYANAGDFKEAIKVYEKCLKVEPNNEVLWFRLGTAFSSAGKLDQAIQAIEKGLKMNPTIVQAWMDLHEVYKKKGDEKKAKWALEKAMGTGKVDIKFAQNEEEAQSKIDEWEEEQKSRKTELDSMVEKRVFPSWSFMVQPDYEETPDGNRIQLTSPDGNRSITVSSLTLEGQATLEIIADLGKKYEQAGLKKKFDIKHKDYTGVVFENDQYAHMGTFVIQCIIAAPSGLLMLTLSFVDTKEDKDWALNVINTVKYYKH